MEMILAGRSEAAGIQREAGYVDSTDVAPRDESERGIGGERSDGGEGLHLLGDHAADSQPRKVDHGRAEGVAFLEVESFALRQGSQQDSVEDVGSGGGTVVGEECAVNNVAIGEMVIGPYGEEVF